MTAAINETTSYLRALENTSTNTTSSINDISTHLNTQGTSIEQQSTEIKALDQAFEAQNKLITTLQFTQIQQGTTIKNMNQVQSDILHKLNILINATQDHDP